MIVTGIQRFSTGDGPGIRTTVFFKGCPLRCKWCHNPETQSKNPELLYAKSHCLNCAACVSVCPAGAHFIGAEGHIYDRLRCIGCTACAAVCPSGALELSGVETSAEAIIETVARDAAFYGTEGGITLSGGEPLLNAEGCMELLKRAKAMSLTTAVETSGFFDAERLGEIAALTDLFLWDIKDTDSARHKRFTGVENKKTLENLALADGLGARTILRCIMVKNVNTDAEHYGKLSEIFSSLANCAGIELVPCRAYGGGKYGLLGRENSISESWTPTEEDIRAARESLTAKGAVVINGETSGGD